MMGNKGVLRKFRKKQDYFRKNGILYQNTGYETAEGHNLLRNGKKERKPEIYRQ